MFAALSQGKKIVSIGQLDLLYLIHIFFALCPKILPKDVDGFYNHQP